MLLLALLLSVADAQEAVAHDTTAPALIRSEAPEWPDLAPAALGEQLIGVILRIDAHGLVTDVRFDPGTPLLFRAPAERMASTMLFEPAHQDGIPVEADVPVRLRFVPPQPMEDEVPADDAIETIVVVGPDVGAPPTTAGDFDIRTRDFQIVPRANATELLTLAPGVMLTQTGGIGHPQQIFMRGFDAREGQDLEFTLEGIPLNDVGNPHGHGVADLHFLIPEAVGSVRILEGPFDPEQGDFAVAGGVTWRPGLADPGAFAKFEGGSFGTVRGVAGWRSAGRAGTLFAGEVTSTQGYGANRAGLRGAAIGRVEGGDEALSFHLIAAAYGSSYDSAGLVRRSDVDAGRIDAFGSMDDRQGGTSMRAILGAGLHGEEGDTAWSVLTYAQLRGMNVRSNFTGFLLDDPRPGESDHGQRGDLLEQSYDARVVGLRASLNRRIEGDPVRGHFTVGVHARYDDANGAARRLRDADGVAYRTELDGHLRQADLAPFVDAGIEAFDRISIHGGVRVESLFYALEDHCPAKDAWYPGAPVDSTNCPTSDRNGVRLPDAWRRAAGIGLAPRVVVEGTLAPGLRLTGAYGQGIRSMEAYTLSDGEVTPFARAQAGEVGVVWEHGLRAWVGRERALGFTTHVDKDLIFDEAEGRNVVAGQTARWGFLLDTEHRVGGFAARASFTYTYAVFGDEIPPSFQYYNSDRVAGKLIPYVPPIVVRADVSQGWDPLRWLHLTHGLGLSYVAPRPLPQSERSAPAFTLDLATDAALGPVRLGLSVQNLLDTRYPLAEYNFSSWFPDTSGAAFPTRVPARHVIYGAPRTVLASITIAPEAFLKEHLDHQHEEDAP